MLNGWQRIWVVLAVLFLILPGLLLLVEEFPNEEEIYHSWAYDTVELTLQLKEFEKLSYWSIRDKYKDLPDQELIKRIQDKYSDSTRGYNLDFTEINIKHKEELAFVDKG